RSAMSRFWLPQYPAGVPAEVDALTPASLKVLLEDACERYAERIAYRSMGTTMTYRQLEQRSRAFAAWLQQRAGLARGDRVAIMLPNILQYPIAMYGALRAGFVVVNVNPLYTATELEHQLKDSGATCVVVLENFAATLEQALPDTAVKHVIVTGVGDLLHQPKGTLVNWLLRYVQRRVPRWLIPGARGLRHVLAEGRALSLSPVSLERNDLAFLQY